MDYYYLYNNKPERGVPTPSDPPRRTSLSLNDNDNPDKDQFKHCLKEKGDTDTFPTIGLVCRSLFASDSFLSGCWLIAS